MYRVGEAVLVGSNSTAKCRGLLRISLLVLCLGSGGLLLEPSQDGPLDLKFRSLPAISVEVRWASDLQRPSRRPPRAGSRPTSLGSAKSPACACIPQSQTRSRLLGYHGKAHARYPDRKSKRLNSSH